MVLAAIFSEPAPSLDGASGHLSFASYPPSLDDRRRSLQEISRDGGILGKKIKRDEGILQ